MPRRLRAIDRAWANMVVFEEKAGKTAARRDCGSRGVENQAGRRSVSVELAIRPGESPVGSGHTRAGMDQTTLGANKFGARRHRANVVDLQLDRRIGLARGQ